MPSIHCKPDRSAPASSVYAIITYAGAQVGHRNSRIYVGNFTLLLGLLLTTVILTHSATGVPAISRTPNILKSSYSLHAADSNQDLSPTPASVKPRAIRVFDNRPAKFDMRLSQSLEDASHLAVPDVLHLIRFHGAFTPTASLSGFVFQAAANPGLTLLDCLTEDTTSTLLFGAPVLVNTRQGIRYVTKTSVNQRYPRATEAHRDQALCTFAEAGISLSRRLNLNGSTHELVEVLRDSISNFELDQAELEWTAVAYALYISNSKIWTNRFGQTFSFDDLTRELLRRGLAAASCAGIHRIYSLLMIARVNNEIRPILTEGVRIALDHDLRQYVDAMCNNQATDGTWNGLWHHSLNVTQPGVWTSDYASDNQRLLVTGHLAELMLYLPAAFRVPDAVLFKSVTWLSKRIEASNMHDIRSNFCPYTHAACVIKACSVPE